MPGQQYISITIKHKYFDVLLSILNKLFLYQFWFLLLMYVVLIFPSCYFLYSSQKLSVETQSLLVPCRWPSWSFRFRIWWPLSWGIKVTGIYSSCHKGQLTSFLTLVLTTGMDMTSVPCLQQTGKWSRIASGLMTRFWAPVGLEHSVWHQWLWSTPSFFSCGYWEVIP